MTPKPWVLVQSEAPNSHYVFTVRRDGSQRLYKTRVRRGPFLHWRAMRRIDRMMRGVA